MGEIQLTINSRTLERFIYILIILVLAFFLAKELWFDGDTAESKTDKASKDADTNSNSGDSNSEDTENEASKEESCSDGIKNQDETDIDCGGTCGGYFYEDDCHSEPKPECRLNSDCDEDYSCINNECVKDEPECSRDSDCNSGFECVSGSCEEIVLSGKVSYTIGKIDAEQTGENVGRVTAVQTFVDNQGDEDLDLVMHILIYEDSRDDFYELVRHVERFTVKSGEEFSRFFTPSSKTFSEPDKQHTVKLEFFEEDDYTDKEDPGKRIGKAEKNFKP